ncbi:MAG: hypothetical protein KTR15_02795, partial [Phycisphaeraceae bacterium]|nr:hypothetical protein [Phycisphaeraceae bacterium]
MSRQATRKTVRFALLYPLLAVLLTALVGPLAGLQAQEQDEEPGQPAQPPVIIECPGPAGHGQPGVPPFARAPQPAGEQPKAKAQPKQPDFTKQLGGEDRYLTHLATDKPIYREGETVYVRGTVLHAFTQKPIDDKKQEIEVINEKINVLQEANKPENRPALNELYRERSMLQQQTRLNPMVEIKDPKGAAIVSGRTNIQDSTLGFKWEVPEDQAGGEYTVKVTYPWSGLAPAERTFDIRAYRPPRIKTQIDFLKDGYGPGDTVVATVEATRAEGGIPEGAEVTAIARVDGEEVARVSTMVRETGNAEVRFDLPDTIERGEGSLTFVIEDGGVVESASKTLPILLQTVDLQLFPEGGELAAWTKNRVYFEAKTPFGKPADIQGEVVDGDGRKVAELETRHEGRGVFAFTPKADETYTLRVTKPSSVTQTFKLPATSLPSATVRTNGVYAFDRPIRFSTPALSGSSGRYELRHRETVVAQHHFAMPEFDNIYGNTQVAFTELPDTATGILTVTAYDVDGRPLAERLIYRAPKHQVNIEIMPDSAQYTPGGEVQLTIKTTDHEGKPIS